MDWNCILLFRIFLDIQRSLAHSLPAANQREGAECVKARLLSKSFRHKSLISKGLVLKKIWKSLENPWKILGKPLEKAWEKLGSGLETGSLPPRAARSSRIAGDAAFVRRRPLRGVWRRSLETSLYLPIKRFLEQRGFSVKGEI